ncbi:hypothetical protein [Bacillus sp. ISL-45]|nr:hypothetical protein [Bacillus sp. ISL-45]
MMSLNLFSALKDFIIRLWRSKLSMRAVYNEFFGGLIGGLFYGE